MGRHLSNLDDYALIANKLKALLIILAIAYGLISVYSLYNPNLGWLGCVLNPTQCATQSFLNYVISLASWVVNPITILVVGIAWLVARHRER